LRCPECHASLLTKSEGKLKVRVPILIFAADGKTCATSCPRCKSEIPVPITLDESAVPNDATAPRLVTTRISKDTR
jgi:uncharacterized protein with PIN domain